MRDLENFPYRRSCRTKFSSFVGRGKINEEGEIPPLDVKEHDCILFGKYSGTEIKFDGEEFLIMREEDVLGILTGARKEKEEPVGAR